MIAVIVVLVVIFGLAFLSCALDDRREHRAAERKAAEERAAHMQELGARWAKKLGVGR